MRTVVSSPVFEVTITLSEAEAKILKHLVSYIRGTTWRSNFSTYYTVEEIDSITVPLHNELDTVLGKIADFRLSLKKGI